MDIASLQQSLDQQKTQLEEIENLMIIASGEDKANLQKLAEDIRELVALTEQSIQLAVAEETKDEPNSIDPFELEYAKLKAELGELEDSTTSEADLNQESCGLAERSAEIALSEIPELASLEGQKCRAPFSHSWGGFDYHNAMIVGVEPVDSSEDGVNIKVKVLYLLPTHESMKTCKYYLEGKCHYGVEECRYSHGEVVSLQSLRDYEEPNFSLVSEGSRILCRYAEDDLWYPARVQSIGKESKLVIRYDAYADQDTQVSIEDVWPLDRPDYPFEETEDDARECSASAQEELTVDNDGETELEIVRTDFLLTAGASSALGDWEKYTKGFGSKMMMKLGYVMGAGLGNKGQGRIEPVDAVILPPGRSLDRCMELKEKAGGQDLLSVEKRLKRQQAAAARKEKRDLERQEASQNHFKSIFDILNSRLCRTDKDVESPTLKKANGTQLKKETCKNLNVRSFQIGEDIRKCANDLRKLQESRKRQMSRNDKIALENIERQINAKEGELQGLRMSEKAINREKDSRTSQKKMQIF